MGNSSGLTSLFIVEVPPPLGRRISSFAISCALHYMGIAIVSYALLHSASIRPPVLHEHFTLRQLDLHIPRPSIADRDPDLYPKTKTATAAKPITKALLNREDPEDRTAEHAATKPGDNAPKQAKVEQPTPRPIPAAKIASGSGEAKQTLVQPTVHTKADIADNTPIPTVMIWTPEKAPARTIVPPLPDPTTAPDVTPSLAIPNEELQLSNLNVTAADKPSPVPTPPAGTTTPVVVKGQELVKMAPATVSNSQNEPTPTSLLSVSDLRLDDGRMVLPPVNETQGNNKTGGQGSGSDQPSGSLESSRVLAAGTGGKGQGAPGNGTDRSAATVGADSSTASEAGMTVDHIQLPPNGKFGVVVVGSSLAEEYPEILQIWSDRVAYTAYLHVGLPKTWILQYAQVRSTDVANSGSVAHIDAPWPYDIFRPNLIATDINADALMVHGILDASGRLESLNIAFPGDYPHAAFVLAALKRWQFRPALQQGKATPVEVLLIIPEESD